MPDLIKEVCTFFVIYLFSLITPTQERKLQLNHLTSTDWGTSITYSDKS